MSYNGRLVCPNVDLEDDLTDFFNDEGISPYLYLDPEEYYWCDELDDVNFDSESTGLEAEHLRHAT